MKTAVITGTTSGIGFETAKQLAAEFNLILVNRNPEKAKKAKELIIQENQDANITNLTADLGEMKEVIRVANEIKNCTSSIDVLINNAGGIMGKYERTSDGLEKTLAVNYFSTFLLNRELMGVLKSTSEKTGDVRIINIASNAHFAGRLDLGNLDYAKGGYNSFKAYADAKLCVVLHTLDFARSLHEEGCYGITVNSVHPGVVRTSFGTSSNVFIKLGWKLFSPFMLSAQEGSKTTVFLANSQAVKGISGEYFAKSKVAHASRFGKDLDLATDLRKKTEELLAKVKP